MNYLPSSASKVSCFKVLHLLGHLTSWNGARFHPGTQDSQWLTLDSGKVTEGLVLHPDNEHILFPLGTTIVLRHIISRTQHFLRGHDNDISVITVSNTGKYIASGQKTHSGF